MTRLKVWEVPSPTGMTYDCWLSAHLPTPVPPCLEVGDRRHNSRSWMGAGAVNSSQKGSVD